MKIPKVFHPILGVIIGTILFLAGIAMVSVTFVGALKAAQYTKEYVKENIHIAKPKWLPL